MLIGRIISISPFVYNTGPRAGKTYYRVGVLLPDGRSGYFNSPEQPTGNAVVCDRISREGETFALPDGTQGRFNRDTLRQVGVTSVSALQQVQADLQVLAGISLGSITTPTPPPAPQPGTVPQGFKAVAQPDGSTIYVQEKVGG